MSEAHGWQRAPDLLGRGVTAPVPNRCWVAGFPHVAATWPTVIYVTFVAGICSLAVGG